MLGAPVCSGAVGSMKPHVQVLNSRQPLRLQTLTSRKAQNLTSSSRQCGFKSRRNNAQTVCKSLANEGNESKSTELTAESMLKKAVSFSWAPLAVALPVYFGNGGGGSNGHGGGGDGDGSGGPGQESNNSRNVIADIADDDDDDDEEEEEEEEEEDEEEEDDDEVSA